MTDKEKLAAMRALGVKWKRGYAIPTYPATMSEAAKRAADALYDSMSMEFRP